MELNGRQYQTRQNVDTEAAFRLHELLPHENRRKPQDIYDHLALARFVSEPTLLPDGGGKGGNFPCAESQIVACWEMGWETIAR